MPRAVDLFIVNLFIYCKNICMGEDPPVLDARDLFCRPGEHVQDPDLETELRSACEKWGFFRLMNHGFSEEILNDAVEATRAFFDLSPSEKATCSRSKQNASGWSNEELTKQQLDLKEIFDFCYIPFRNLPDDHPDNRSIDGWNKFFDEGQRTALLRYFDEMEACSFALLHSLCRAFGLNFDVVKDLCQDGVGFCRLNYYQPRGSYSPSKHVVGIHDHTDAGIFTILWTSEVRGLEFKRDDRYISLDPLPGSLTVNLGDMFAVLMNGLCNAPVHRVIITEDDRRYSIAFFFNPGPSAVVSPDPQCVKRLGRRMYQDISWSEFRSRRFQGDFEDLGREVQIKDYLLHD